MQAPPRKPPGYASRQHKPAWGSELGGWEARPETSGSSGGLNYECLWVSNLFGRGFLLSPHTAMTKYPDGGSLTSSPLLIHLFYF